MQSWHAHWTAEEQRACNTSTPTWKSEDRGAVTRARKGSAAVTSPQRVRTQHTPASILISVERDCQHRLSSIGRFNLFLRTCEAAGVTIPHGYHPYLQPTFPPHQNFCLGSFVTFPYPSYFPRRLSGLPHCPRPYFAPSVVGISVSVPVRVCTSPVCYRILRFMFRYASVLRRVCYRILRRRKPEICHSLLDCSDGLLDCSDSSCSPFSLRLCLFVHGISKVCGSGKCYGFDVTVSFLRSLSSAAF